VTHEIEDAAMCIVNTRHAFWVLGIWAAGMLVHALWRSTGEAPQDPLRPSGPTQ
jgi:hypothetical protein